MRYLSLFSGIGGFELGIQQAYENLSHTCVGFSEIDKHAIQIYQKHFPEHKNYGDIKKIKTKELPQFDFLVGGFPCQAFSIAGKRGGFNDTRGTLFFEIARILKDKQPRLFLLENVKGLLSHDQGRTFITIISTLDELGYDLQWQVLNSKNFGVPQNRERVFIVGHLRGTSRPEVFPFRESNELSSTEQLESSTSISALTSTDYKGPSKQRPNLVVPVGVFRTFKNGQGFRENKKNLSPTIQNRAREDGSGQPVIFEGTKIRRLTPVECERLQGFPDQWTADLSDTQRYKCLGNAVTVNVIEAVVSRLI